MVHYLRKMGVKKKVGPWPHGDSFRLARPLPGPRVRAPGSQDQQKLKFERSVAILAQATLAQATLTQATLAEAQR